MRDIRQHLASANQRTVLSETASALLEEDGRSVDDWVSNQIEKEIDDQTHQLLALASSDYDAFDRKRVRAVHAYGRADPVVCVLAGAAAGYVFLVIAGSRFLPLAAANPGLGWTLWLLAVLAVALAIRWTLWWRHQADLLRSVPEAYGRWIEVLRDQVLRPFIVEQRNEEVRNPQLFDTRIGEKSPPRLIEGTEPRRLVRTDAMDRVEATAKNVHSGSLGVSGPRGVGKSTILQFFGTGAAAANDPDLRLVIPAPVDYEPREFIILLFGELCDAVMKSPGDRSAIEKDTRYHLEELKFLRTYTSNWSASVTPRSFLTIARGYSKERSEQPVTFPELVNRFRTYSGQVASWRQSAHDGQGRVVIGIDEVDKIRDSDRAEAFLNDVKAIFGAPGCLYLVSLSEDALTGFARRTPSIRSAFDTAFDELVPVGPMTYRHSEQLLFKRVTDVPRPFIALCHVLAGGLPRDLVRAARALIDVTPATGERTLTDTARDLILRELESLRQASVRQFAIESAPGPLLAAMQDSQWPGPTSRKFTEAALQVADAARDTESDAIRRLSQDLVVSLSFYATALEVFSADWESRLVACLRDQDYAIVDDLATARYTTRLNSGLAHQLLEKYRWEHGMRPVSAIG
jgi:hypothetical protein